MADKWFMYANNQAAKEYHALPESVMAPFDAELRRIQRGLAPLNSATLTQFGGGLDVIEIKEDYDSDTYRCVYTVRFADAVIVLAAWAKKSKHGIAMEPEKVRLIERRLRSARDTYDAWKREREVHPAKEREA